MNNVEYTQDDLKAIRYALELAIEIIDEKIETEEIPEYRLIDCIGESNVVVCYGTYDEIQDSAEQWIADSGGCCDLEIQQYSLERERYITVEYVGNKS